MTQCNSLNVKLSNSQLNEPNNLPNKIKDGAYAINLDEYFDIGTHWVALYVQNNDVTYFYSFGVEDVPKEIIYRQSKLKNKYF